MKKLWVMCFTTECIFPSDFSDKSIKFSISFFIKLNHSIFFTAILSYLTQSYPFFLQFENTIPVSFNTFVTLGLPGNHLTYQNYYLLSILMSTDISTLENCIH